MLVSLLIAAHNEGDRLWRTVQSSLESVRRLRMEVIVADDASEDGCVEEVRRRFPKVRIITQRKRMGPAPTKDLAASHAAGRVLVFLDGHSKPEPNAIEELVRTVKRKLGRAIITPRIAQLDCDRWELDRTWMGYGFYVRLEDLKCGWHSRISMKWRPGLYGRLYETPTLVGCCFAMTRKLYEKLKGMDPYMSEWGVEDVDLGLKAWLMGYSVLNTPYATVGHRFRGSFDNYTVSHDAFVYNLLRMARKNFTEEVWTEWLDRYRLTEPEHIWKAAWARFCTTRDSLEVERAYLMAHRAHDEFWFAEKFGLDWPKKPFPSPGALRVGSRAQAQSGSPQ